MYEEKYVNRRKKKIAASITAGVSATGITALAIVAFLGRYVGTFTVALNTGKLELSLSNKIDFSEKSSFLMISQLPHFEEYTYGNILKQIDTLDSEETQWYEKPGAVIPEGLDVDPKNVISLNFFKYTFYVKNTGNQPAAYDLYLRVTENTLGKDGRSLLDTMRVMFFENDGQMPNEHDFHLYAKRAAVRTGRDDGGSEFDEYASVPLDEADEANPFMGYAEQFQYLNQEGLGEITTRKVTDFIKDDVKRYTIITWLEGYDPQSSKYDNAPEGATVKLGVEISAYEN